MLSDQSPSAASAPFASYAPRVAVVTGGSQGLGYAIALRLAEDGIDIAINDIAPKLDQINAAVDEVRKKGRRAVAIPGDGSSEADVKSKIEKVANELGSVDIVMTTQFLRTCFSRAL